MKKLREKGLTDKYAAKLKMTPIELENFMLERFKKVRDESEKHLPNRVCMQ